jgi:hypothetical protein
VAPDANFPRLVPCRLDFLMLQRDREADLNSLLNRCQMHNCSKFCMRKGVCKVGCGKETESKKCDTPGFPLRTHDSVDRDHRGITKMFLTRGNARVNQTPGLPSKLAWQLVYRYSFTRVSLEAGHNGSCSGCWLLHILAKEMQLKEEMAQTRNLVMHSSELTGCQAMYTVCAGRV